MYAIRSYYELLDAAGDFVRVSVHGNRAPGNVLHPVGADDLLHRFPGGENLFRGASDRLDRRGKLVPVALHRRLLLGLENALDIAAEVSRDSYNFV